MTLTNIDLISVDNRYLYIFLELFYFSLLSSAFKHLLFSKEAQAGEENSTIIITPYLSIFLYANINVGKLAFAWRGYYLSYNYADIDRQTKGETILPS